MVEALKKFAGETVGYCECFMCSGKVSVKINKSGHAYYYCTNHPCKYESRPGSDFTDEKMAERVTRWIKPEARKILMDRADDEDDEDEEETVFSVKV